MNTAQPLLTQGRIVVAANPIAGARPRQSLVEQLQVALERRGYEVLCCHDLDQLVEMTAPVGHELRAVIAAGGDGTASSVASRLAPGIPLAILPLGTENLLAKYLNTPQEPEQLARLFDNAYAVRLDAGQANGQLFLLMLGCGFDADVVRRVHAARTGHIRHLSYAKPIWQAIRRYEYPTLRLTAEGCEGEASGPRLVEARWAFVVNLPRYAAGLQIAPEASGCDGYLDVCTFRRGSFVQGLRYLLGVISNRHQHMPDCTFFRTRKLRIESDQPVPYQLDGDPGGLLPVQIEVLPRHLTVVVSEAWCREHGFQPAGDLH